MSDLAAEGSFFHRHRASLAVAAMLAGNAALAVGPWLVRLAEIAPAASAFWRLAIALPFLALMVRMMKQSVPARPRIWLILSIGGLFFAADLISWHSGIVLTKLANATVLGNAASFMFVAYGFIIARQLPAPRQWIAIGLAVAGMTLLIGRSYDLSPRYLLGDLLCLTGGLFYTGYLIAMDRVRGQIQSWSALAISTACGLPALWLFVIATGPVMPEHWTPLILLAIGSQVIGQGLLIYALSQLSPVVVGIGLLTQPAIGATIGWFAYSERLSPMDIAGMAAVGLAVILARSNAEARPALSQASSNDAG